MKNMMLITLFEIAFNYPDQIQIDVAGPDENGKFAALMYRLKGDTIHKLMCSSEYCFDSVDAAKTSLHIVCQDCVDYLRHRPSDQRTKNNHWNNMVVIRRKRYRAAYAGGSLIHGDPLEPNFLTR